ncbi:MAG: type II secretion system GspH family protein [Firmicutes bacterium]|nr:type II secretion system GspH family protein [Bacillota bacterium]
MKRKPTNTRRLSKGFTLIEVMVTLLIFVMAMGMLTSLITKGFQTYSQGKTMTTLQDETRKAINTISSEIREADTAYPITANGDILTFTKVDPFTYCSGSTLELQVSPPSSSTGGTEQVEYFLSNNQIIREVCGNPDDSFIITPPQIKVAALSFSNNAALPDLITITMQTEEYASGEKRPKIYNLRTEVAPRSGESY